MTKVDLMEIPFDEWPIEAVIVFEEENRKQWAKFDKFIAKFWEWVRKYGIE